MTHLKPKDIAPEFTAKTNEGDVKSTDYKGKYLILYFYPQDNTPGCSLQAQDFSDLYNQFLELNTEILGVSRNTLNSHDKFCKKYNIPYALISDEDSELCDQYDVLKEKSMFGKKYIGIARSTFLIDKEQKILKIWKDVKPKKHAQELLDFIKSL